MGGSGLTVKAPTSIYKYVPKSLASKSMVLSLETLGNVRRSFGCHNWGRWRYSHLVPRCQGYCEKSQPTTLAKSIPLQLSVVPRLRKKTCSTYLSISVLLGLSITSLNATF